MASIDIFRLSCVISFSVSPISFGAKATDTRVTVARGRLEVALLPTDDVSSVSCTKNCSAENLDGGATWWTNVLPQLANKSYFGRHPHLAQLSPGDTLSVPLDWFYVTRSLEDTVVVVEQVLSAEESFEDLAVALSASEFHAMKRFLERREEMRKGARRFVETARQVDKARKKERKNNEKNNQKQE
jgi:hypothetical protein